VWHKRYTTSLQPIYKQIYSQARPKKKRRGQATSSKLAIGYSQHEQWGNIAYDLKVIRKGHALKAVEYKQT
jgi:hypothetical protein